MINFKKRLLSAVVAASMILSSFTFTAIAEETTEITKVYADKYGIEITYAEEPDSLPDIAFEALDGTEVDITVDEKVDSNNICHVHFNEEIELDTDYRLIIGDEVKTVKVVTYLYDNFDDEDYEGFTTGVDKQVTVTETDSETGETSETTKTITSYLHTNKNNFKGNGWTAKDEDSSATRINGVYITDSQYGATEEDKKLVMMGYNQYLEIVPESPDYTFTAVTQTYWVTESARASILAKSAANTATKAHWLSYDTSKAGPTTARVTWSDNGSKWNQYDEDGNLLYKKDEQGNPTTEVDYWTEPDFDPIAIVIPPTTTGYKNHYNSFYLHRTPGVDIADERTGFSAKSGAYSYVYGNGASSKPLNEDGSYSEIKIGESVEGALRNYGDKFAAYIENDEEGYNFSGTLTDQSSNRVSGTDLLSQNRCGVKSHISGVVVVDEILVTTSEVTNVYDDAAIENENIYVDQYGIDIRMDSHASQEQIDKAKVFTLSGEEVDVTTEFDETNNILHIHFDKPIAIDTMYELIVEGKETTVKKYIKVIELVNENFNDAKFTGVTAGKVADGATAPTYDATDSKIISSNGVSWRFVSRTFVTNDPNLGASAEDQKVVVFSKGTDSSDVTDGTFGTDSSNSWNGKNVTYSAQTQIYSIADASTVSYAHMFVDGYSVAGKAKGFSIGPTQSKFSMTTHDKVDGGWPQYAFTYSATCPGDIVKFTDTSTLGKLADFNTSTGTYTSVTTKATPVTHVVRTVDDQFSGYAGTYGDMHFAHTLTAPVASTYPSSFGFGFPNIANGGLMTVDNIVVTSCEVLDYIEVAEINNIYVDQYGVDIAFADTPSLAQQVPVVTTAKDEAVAQTVEFDETNNIIHIIFDEPIERDTYYKLTVGDLVQFVAARTVVEENFDDCESLATGSFANGKGVNDGGIALTTEARFGASATNKKVIVSTAQKGFYALTSEEDGTDMTVSADINTFCNGATDTAAALYKRVNGVDRPSEQDPSLTEEPQTSWTTAIAPEYGGGNSVKITAGEVTIGNPADWGFVMQDYYVYTRYLAMSTASSTKATEAEAAGDTDLAAQWTERAAYYKKLAFSTSISAPTITLAKDTANKPYAGTIGDGSTAVAAPFEGATVTTGKTLNLALRAYDKTGAGEASDTMAGFIGIDGADLEYKGTTFDERRAVVGAVNRIGVSVNTKSVAVVDNFVITKSEVVDYVETATFTNDYVYIDLYGVDIRFDSEPSLAQKKNTIVTDRKGNKVEATTEYDEEKKILHLHFKETIERDTAYTLNVDGVEKTVKVVTELKEDFNSADFTTATTPEGATEPTFATRKEATYTNNGVTWRARASTYVYSTNDPNFGASNEDKKIVLFGTDTHFATDGTVPWSKKDVTYSAQTQTYKMTASSSVAHAYINVDGYRVSSGKTKALSIGSVQSKLSMTSGGTKKADGTSFVPPSGSSYAGWQNYGFTSTDKSAYGDIIPTVSAGTSGAFTDYDSTTGKYTTAPTKATTLTHAIRTVGDQFSGYAGTAGNMGFASVLTTPTELVPSASDSGRVAAGVYNTGTILVIDNVLVTSSEVTDMVADAEIKTIYADKYGIDIKLSNKPSLAQEKPEIKTTTGKVVATSEKFDETNNILHVFFEENIALDTFYKLTIGNEEKFFSVKKIASENFDNLDKITTGAFANGKGVVGGGVSLTTDSRFGASASDKKALLTVNQKGLYVLTDEKDSVNITVSADINTFRNGAEDTSAALYKRVNGVYRPSVQDPSLTEEPQTSWVTSISPDSAGGNSIKVTAGGATIGNPAEWGFVMQDYYVYTHYLAMETAAKAKAKEAETAGNADLAAQWTERAAYYKKLAFSTSISAPTITLAKDTNKSFAGTIGDNSTTVAAPFDGATITKGKTLNLVLRAYDSTGKNEASDVMGGFVGIDGADLEFKGTTIDERRAVVAGQQRAGVDVGSATSVAVVDNLLVTTCVIMDEQIADGSISSIYADIYGIDVRLNGPASITQQQNITVTDTADNKVKFSKEYDEENYILHVHFDDTIQTGKVYIVDVDGVENKFRVNKEFEENFNDAKFATPDAKNEVSNNGVTWLFTKAKATTDANLVDDENDQAIVITGQNALFRTGSSTPWSGKEYTVSAQTQAYMLDADGNEPTYIGMLTGSTSWANRSRGFAIGPNQSKLSATYGYAPNEFTTKEYAQWAFDYNANYKGDKVATVSNGRGSFVGYNAETGEYESVNKPTTLTHAIRIVGNQFSGYAGVEGDMAFAHTLNPPADMASPYPGALMFAIQETTGSNGMLVVDDILVTTCETLEDVADAQIANVYVDQYGADITFEGVPSLAQQEAKFTTTRDEEIKASTTVDMQNNIVHIVFDEKIKINKYYKLSIGSVVKYVKVTTLASENFDSLEEIKTGSFADGKGVVTGGVSITTDSRFGASQTDKKAVLTANQKGLYVLTEETDGTDFTVSADINTFCNGAEDTSAALYKRVNGLYRPSEQDPSLTEEPQTAWTTSISPDSAGGNSIKVTAGAVSMGNPANYGFVMQDYYVYTRYLAMQTAATTKATEAETAGNAALAAQWTERAAYYKELAFSTSISAPTITLAKDTNKSFAGTIGDNSTTVAAPFDGATITKGKTLSLALRAYDKTGKGEASDVMAGFIGLDGADLEYKGTTIDERRAVVAGQQRLGVDLGTGTSVAVVDNLLVTTCVVYDSSVMTTEIYTVEDIWADLDGIYVEFDKPLVDDDDFSQISVIEAKKEVDFTTEVNGNIVTIVPQGGMDTTGKLYSVTVPAKFEPRDFAQTDKAYAESFTVKELIDEDFSNGLTDSVNVAYKNPYDEEGEYPRGRAQVENGALLLRDAIITLPALAGETDYVVDFDATVYTSVFDRTYEEDTAFTGSYEDAVPNINMWINSDSTEECAGGYMWNIKNATVQRFAFSKEGVQTQVDETAKTSSQINFGDAYYYEGFNVIEKGTKIGDNFEWNTNVDGAPTVSKHGAFTYPIRVEKNTKAAKYYMDNVLQSEFIGNEAENANEFGEFGIRISGTEYVVIDNIKAYSYTEIADVTVALDGDEVVVTNITTADKPVVIVVAAYDDNNKMLDAWVSETKNLTSEKVLEEAYNLNTTNATKIKAFVWNDMTNLKPYCAPAIGGVN